MADEGGSANPFGTAAQPAQPLDAATFGGNGETQAEGGNPFGVAAAPGAAPPSGQDNGDMQDARIAWRAENAKVLEAREAEEKQVNDANKVKATEWLKKFNAEREARIAKAKEENTAQEQAATMGPVGDTSWEKVQSMIDFTFKPPQEKEAERERFKQVLMTAKERDVPCPM